MRTIKFRAKEAETGKWMYGDLFQRTGFYPSIITSYIKDDGKIGYAENAAIQDTLGQFTGLHDKNGKEIYEGDIVQVKSLKGAVTWHPEGYFCIHTQKCDIAETSYNAIGDLVDWLHREYYADGLEIIGNIHDNPELLKGGENEIR